MEKIYFDDTTFIWKTKLNLLSNKDTIVEQAKSIIKSNPKTTTDGYAYKKIENDEVMIVTNCCNQPILDEIIELSTNYCKEIYPKSNEFNRINTESWVNVVRSDNPIQKSYKDKVKKGQLSYHIHTELNKIREKFIPNYTYVYYIQMPDIMEEDDGVLYFKGEHDKEYWIRPEEDDLIIMPATIPHSPNNAPKSTIDRIVFAGNIGFELIKKNKTLI